MMRATALGPAMRTTYLWLMFVVLETTAQLALKMAATSAGGHVDPWRSINPIVANPWFVGSIACDAANLLLWLAILRRHDLSLAVPLSSVTYFTVLLAAGLLLHEPISAPQLAGLMLVGIGLTLVTWDEAPAERTQPRL